MKFDPRRHALPLAALWWAVVTAVMLALRPPTPVDETRYLTVAWEMWQSGDWISLRMNGEAYGHKPPLLFWLINLGWSIFGVSVWWPRAMLAGMALGALVLTRRLSRLMVPGDEAVAAMAMLITASSLYWMGFTAAVMFDTMLTLIVLIAVSAVVWASRGGGWRAWIAIGLALGAGILTKGPVVLLHVLPLALLAPWWLRKAPTTWRAWYGGIALAVVIGAAVALAWAIPTALAAGAHFGREIFWSQSAGRMVGGTAPHARPAWFYLPGLVLLAWPWLLWPRLWRGLASLRSASRPEVRFALAWCVPPFIAFSAFSGKQVQYLMPLLPAVALLAAIGLSVAGNASRKGSALIAAAYLLVAGGVVWFAMQAQAADLFGTGAALFAATAVTVACLTGAAALVVAVPACRPVSAVAAIGCAAVVGASGILLGLGQAYLTPRDSQQVGRIVAAVQATGQPVAQLGKYHGDYQFLGRLQRPIESIDSVDALYSWAQAHPEGCVIVHSYGPMSHRDAREPLISQRYMDRRVTVWRGADLAGVSRDWKRAREDDSSG